MDCQPQVSHKMIKPDSCLAGGPDDQDVCIAMMKIAFFLCCTLLATHACAAKVTTAAQDRALFAEFTEQQARAKVCLAAVPGFAEQFAPALRKWRQRNEYALKLGDAFARTDAPEDQPATSSSDKPTETPDIATQCKAVLTWLEGG